ncbi:uncharacterized protein LOC109854743 [Pseudomyrmex gracilis]|uniref:uncharacterized protein LOC109854743 n=1 Tax=Pseudomyrmex gracilis TaxID=219809 RepID=UPI000995A1A5|nr:uncharacterized protein LOC109854743 [Pseudomyrmex gracilis]
MYFWTINKPTGRYYGYTCRRFPATSVHKTHFDRRIEFRQSAHRFQGLAGNFAVGSTSAAGPSNVNHSCGSIISRSFATSARSHNENRRHGSTSLNAAHLTHPSNISNNVTDTSNNQLILTNATGANNANRNPGFSEPLGTVTLADLRCAILPSVITLIIGVSFIATIKIYSGQASLEVIALFAFFVFLLSVCFVFVACVRRHCPRGRTEQNARTIQEDHLAALTNTHPGGISESVARTTLTTVPTTTTTVRPSAPPPPYHIAILMPPDEAPPPSYDKVIR